MTNLFMSQEIYQYKRQLRCFLEPEADFLILIKKTFSRRNARPLYEKDVKQNISVSHDKFSSWSSVFRF